MSSPRQQNYPSYPFRHPGQDAPRKRKREKERPRTRTPRCRGVFFLRVSPLYHFFFYYFILIFHLSPCSHLVTPSSPSSTPITSPPNPKKGKKKFLPIPLFYPTPILLTSPHCCLIGPSLCFACPFFPSRPSYRPIVHYLFLIIIIHRAAHYTIGSRISRRSHTFSLVSE
ncbi:hypothetical protein GGR52DRAFT_22300 [Hypoxylon sp. FL1284]|nr:hypothetical protein GGR52DRAFT_22300 [Hypoxylon sp. FL1284]